MIDRDKEGSMADVQVDPDLIYDGNAARPQPSGPPKGAPALYGEASVVTGVFDRREPELSDVGFSPAERQALRRDLAHVARATDEGIALQLQEKYLDQELASRRRLDPDEGIEERHEQILKNNEALREKFRLRYGQTEGAARLARTAAFVRKDATLARIFQQHGLGSDPDLVEKLADFVFSSGWRG
jgi:hypothetical protein